MPRAASRIADEVRAREIGAVGRGGAGSGGAESVTSRLDPSRLLTTIMRAKAQGLQPSECEQPIQSAYARYAER